MTYGDCIACGKASVVAGVTVGAVVPRGCDLSDAGSEVPGVTVGRVSRGVGRDASAT